MNGDELFDPYKPFRQVNGLPAFIYTRNEPPPYIFLGEAVLHNGEKVMASWTREGKFTADAKRKAGPDLINIPSPEPSNE